MHFHSIHAIKVFRSDLPYGWHANSMSISQNAKFVKSKTDSFRIKTLSKGVISFVESDLPLHAGRIYFEGVNSPERPWNLPEYLDFDMVSLMVDKLFLKLIFFFFFLAFILFCIFLCDAFKECRPEVLADSEKYTQFARKVNQQLRWCR